MTRLTNPDPLMIPHPFVAEKPRVIPWPEGLHPTVKFELTLGEPGTDDFHCTIGSSLDEALPRFALIVARERLRAAHCARSWSE